MELIVQFQSTKKFKQEIFQMMFPKLNSRFQVQTRKKNPTNKTQETENPTKQKQIQQNAKHTSLNERTLQH
jgi:hypothetical protein